MNKRTSFRRKSILISLILVVAIVVGLALLVIPRTTFYAHHTSGPALPYQAMEPTWLPDDLKVSPTQLSVIDRKGSFDKSIIFQSSDERFRFIESEDPGSVRMDCGSAPTNSKCEVMTTSLGNKYVFETHFVGENGDLSPQSYQTIQYISGGAYFFVNLEKELVDKHSKEDWSRMIDSFQGMDVTKLPIKVSPYAHFGG